MRLRSGVTCAAVMLALTAVVHADEVPIGETTFNSKIFVDLTHLDQQAKGTRTDASGTDADLKRFYLDVNHRFSSVWSARVTTDINWLRNQDPTDLWFRHAYLQAQFSKAFALRVGSAPMPWVALINKWSGYRYVEKELVSRVKVGESADWGVHALGSLGAEARAQYAVSVVTGAGYKKPRVGNGPDVAARMSWQPSEHTIVGVGGYRGTQAQDVSGRSALHTAQRWSLMAAYADARWRVGAQYFRARNFGRVLQPLGDRSDGWSAWASMQLTPKVALIARHDHTKPSASLNPQRRDRYSYGGVEWTARKWLRLAAVLKRERLVDNVQHLRTVNEAGLWAQLAF